MLSGTIYVFDNCCRAVYFFFTSITTNESIRYWNMYLKDKVPMNITQEQVRIVMSGMYRAVAVHETPGVGAKSMYFYVGNNVEIVYEFDIYGLLYSMHAQEKGHWLLRHSDDNETLIMPSYLPRTIEEKIQDIIHRFLR